MPPSRFYIITDEATKEKLVPIAYDTAKFDCASRKEAHQALGLEGSGFWAVAACPAGYRAQEDKHSALPKVRFSKEEIINYLP